MSDTEEYFVAIFKNYKKKEYYHQRDDKEGYD